MSKIDHSLFTASEHALEEAFGVCPECGEKLRIRNSKNGRFVGCSAYPECDYSKPLHDVETQQIKIIEGSQCPQCQSELAIKKGRYGLFIGCTNFPECHHIAKISQQSDTKLTCPSCNKGHLIERTNKYGKRFFACNRYPDCKYLLNDKPVAHECPKCQWPVMVVKSSGDKTVLKCPQKQCGEKVITS